MRVQRAIQSIFLVVATSFSNGSAATIYNEGISGDLPNSGLEPKLLAVGVGSNQVFGTTGRVTATDRDYFRITLGPGLELTAIIELPGTTAGGVSFIGIEAGSQVTVSTGATEATGLLGWWHYSPADINTNILPEMAVPAEGSAGFTVPLGPGSYSFWIQDFSAGTFDYGFDLVVSETPEPGTAGALLAGLAVMSILLSRRTRQCPAQHSPQ